MTSLSSTAKDSSSDSRKAAWWRWVLDPFLLVITAAIALGTWETYRYWGYFLVRPAMLAEVDEISTVETWGDLQAYSYIPGTETLKIEARENHSWDASLENAESYCKAASNIFWDHSCLYNQAFLNLSQRKILTPETSLLGTGELNKWHQKLMDTGMVRKPSPGWEGNDQREGMVFLGRDRQDKPIAFVGIQGGQVENDHYPYYELIFREVEGSPGEWEITAQRSFYIDIAGYEQLDLFFLGFASIKWLIFLSPILFLLYAPKVWKSFKGDA
ncbi:MAG: hypothetical protein AAF889_09935 [Cyanobacteria bacterium P01_D01_bin.73]